MRRRFLNGLLTCLDLGIAPKRNPVWRTADAAGKGHRRHAADAEGRCDPDRLRRRRRCLQLLKRLTLVQACARMLRSNERSDLGVVVFAGARDPAIARRPPPPASPRAAHRPGDADTYHAARIAAGLAEQGVDFGAEEVFPADINMDLARRRRFQEGLFRRPGSRLAHEAPRHRAAAHAEGPAVAGLTACDLAILADGFEIGVLTSVSGGAAPRPRAYRPHGGGQGEGRRDHGERRKPLAFDKPGWLAGELAAMAEAKEARGG